MSKFSPIHISLSPNTESEDTKEALKLLFSPWRWQEGNAIKKLEENFTKFLGGQPAFSFNSGRSAFYSLLKAAGVKQGDEVIIQAFSCIAVPQPIIWAGGKPIYADIKKGTYNLDPIEVERKISPKTKAIVVQHSFGRPAQIEKLKDIAEKNNLLLIEDCALALGAESKNKKVGTFGDAAFFSLGRDKSISSVYGGMATTKNKEIEQELKKIYKSLDYPSALWTLQQILHPIIFNYLALPTYNFFKLGQGIIYLSQKLGFLSWAVTKKEKKEAKKPDYFPKKLPNALARLGLVQFKKLDKLNRHRKEIAEFYYDNLKTTNYKLPPKEKTKANTFLRFPIKTKNATDILLKAKEEGILLGDWYQAPLLPADADFEKIKYKKGSCPNAESLTSKILNLPTHINTNEEKAQTIVTFLKEQKI